MRSLTFKLTIAFLFVSLTGIALVALAVWGFTSLEFNRFLIDRGLNEYTTEATTYYRVHGSWVGVEEAFQGKGLGYAQNFTEAGAQGNTQGENPPPPPFVLVDPSGNVIIASARMHVGERLLVSKDQQKLPITVDRRVVGYVLTTGGAPRIGPFEARFQNRMNRSLLLAAAGAGALAVLLGLILARSITRPVRELTEAATAMSKGNLNQQVKVRSRDELGQLTLAFNKMGADLEHANQLRRQMTADIAHDLRTPLSVITGYLEGLKDGIIKPSPKRFAAMHDEALFLQRLVEDLRILSLADAGELSINRMDVQPGDVIERLAGSFQHQAEKQQVALVSEVQEGLPAVKIDPERMQQAMRNLVSNALRYTPAGGEITLAARQEEHAVLLEVKDTGSGIPAEDLPHIFERFYRGDESRQEGGSGLGLAIAKSIIELQGGRISADSAGPGQGSSFRIKIPVGISPQPLS